jgi:hypothetical protein
MQWLNKNPTHKSELVSGSSLCRAASASLAYLAPNSSSLQKPVEGLSVMALSVAISMLKNQQGKEKDRMKQSVKILVSVIYNSS